MKRILLIAAIVLLAACTPTRKGPPLHVTTGVSKSTGDTYIYSPMNVLLPSKTLPMRVMWQLNSEITKEDHVVTHTLRISIAYAASKHNRYASVIDDKGDALKFVPVGKSGKACPGKTCTLSDTLDVYLPDADLRARAKTGWPFKLATKNQQTIPATVSPEIIVLQLAETDKAVKADTRVK